MLQSDRFASIWTSVIIFFIVIFSNFTFSLKERDMMFFCHCYKYITTENFLRIMSDEIVLCLPRKMFNTYFFLQYLILHYVNLKIREPNKCKSICMLSYFCYYGLFFFYFFNAAINLFMLLSIYVCYYNNLYAIKTPNS